MAVMERSSSMALCGIIMLMGFWLSGSTAAHLVHSGSRRLLAEADSGIVAVKTCKERKGVAVLMVAQLGDNKNRFNHYLYWLSVVSKRLYAHAKGYPLYVVSHRLQDKRHAAWEKLIAIHAAMVHSCAEWLWVNDSDAWIINLDLDIKTLIDRIVRENVDKNSITPDVFVTNDCDGLNTGSMIFHHTDWTLQHLADLWFTNGQQINKIQYFWEQAAIGHLMNHTAVKEHYIKVKQVELNAYATSSKCSDGSGTYRTDVSHILHAPGGYKHELYAEFETLAPVLRPANIARLKDNPDVPVYALYGHAHAPKPKDSPTFRSPKVTTVTVPFKKSPVAGPSDENADSVTFEVEVALKPADAINPAWPVIAPTFLRRIVSTVISFAQMEWSDR